MKRTPVSGVVHGVVFALLCLLPIVGAAAELAVAPSLELLEFLGEWETVDGEWLDPIQLLEELDSGVTAEQDTVPQHEQVEEYDDD